MKEYNEFAEKHKLLDLKTAAITLVVCILIGTPIFLINYSYTYIIPTIDPQASTVEITTRAQLDHAIDSVVKGDVDAQRIYGSNAISDYHCIAVKTHERLEYLAELSGAEVTDGKLTREFEYRGVTIYTRLGDAV